MEGIAGAEAKPVGWGQLQQYLKKNGCYSEGNSHLNKWGIIQSEKVPSVLYFRFIMLVVCMEFEGRPFGSLDERQRSGVRQQKWIRDKWSTCFGVWIDKICKKCEGRERQRNQDDSCFLGVYRSCLKRQL